MTNEESTVAKAKKTSSKQPRGKIWVAYIDLSYEVVGAGTTEREAIDAATKFAATWLKGREFLGEQHEGGPWTPARVEEHFGVRTYHVPIGGASQS